MKKLSIALYIVLLISVVASGMLWASADPSSDVTGGADSSSATTSQDTGSADASSGTTTSTDTSADTSGTESDASSGEGESSAASEDISSVSEASSAEESSSEASSAAARSSSRAQSSSSTVSKTPPPYQDEGYIYGTEDEESYVEVTSDSLSQPADTDGDGIDDEEEEKMDNSVAGRITRIIWIPILLAVASAAGLITINVLYKKKYGKLMPKKEKKEKKNKNKKANLYIPRD